MPTARLLTGPPEVEFRASDGKRVLVRDLAVSIGEELEALDEWAMETETKRLDAYIYITDPHEREDLGWGTMATVIHVRAGLVYDGASMQRRFPIVGWLIRVLAGPKERYEAAAVFHDALYQARAPRAAADRVFWLVARSGACRVGRFRGWLTWAALRAFAYPAWRSYDRT